MPQIAILIQGEETRAEDGAERPVAEEQPAAALLLVEERSEAPARSSVKRSW